jgi:hypothetical protein
LTRKRKRGTGSCAIRMRGGPRETGRARAPAKAAAVAESEVAAEVKTAAETGRKPRRRPGDAGQRRRVDGPCGGAQTHLHVNATLSRNRWPRAGFGLMPGKPPRFAAPPGRGEGPAARAASVPQGDLRSPRPAGLFAGQPRFRREIFRFRGRRQVTGGRRFIGAAPASRLPCPGRPQASRPEAGRRFAGEPPAAAAPELPRSEYPEPPSRQGGLEPSGQPAARKGCQGFPARHVRSPQAAASPRHARHPGRRAARPAVFPRPTALWPFAGPPRP